MTGEIAVARIGEAVDDLCCDLAEIINRIVRPHAVLRLERADGRWLVIDDRNDQIMIPASDYGMAVRFAQTFVVRHPGATMDRSFGLAKGSGEGEPAGLGHSSPAASPDQFSVSVDHLDVADVIPIRKGA